MQANHPISTQPKSTFVKSDHVTKAGAIFRHHFLFVAWATMEVALIVPLAYAIMQWLDLFQPGLLTLNLLALILFPSYFSRFLSWLKIPIETQKNVLIVFVFLLIIWAIRTFLYDLDSIFDFSWVSQLFRNMTLANNNLWHRDFGLFLLIAVCWWRGMLLVNQELDVSRFGVRFRNGGLIIAPLALLLAAYRLEWSVLSYLLLFLFAGLTAVVLTRIEQAERDQAATLDSINVRWFVTIMGGGFSLILAAILLALLISGESGNQIGGFLGPIWLGFQFLFSSILLLVIFLLSPLLPLIEAGANRFMEFLRQLFGWFFTERETPNQEPPADPAQQINELINELLLEAQQEGYRALLDWKLVLLGLMFLTIIVVAVLLMRNYRRNKNRAADGRFDKSVGGFLARIQHNRQKRAKARQSALKIDWRAALTIRRIYKQMVYFANEQGYGRDNNETPYEFLTRLHALWPAQKEQTKLITHAFVKIRYGELPESLEELNQIKQAWTQLKKAIAEQD